jgi:hypothetical protein
MASIASLNFLATNLDANVHVKHVSSRELVDNLFNPKGASPRALLYRHLSSKVFSSTLSDSYEESFRSHHVSGCELDKDQRSLFHM